MILKAPKYSLLNKNCRYINLNICICYAIFCARNCCSRTLWKNGHNNFIIFSSTFNVQRLTPNKTGLRKYNSKLICYCIEAKDEIRIIKHVNDKVNCCILCVENRERENEKVFRFVQFHHRE